MGCCYWLSPWPWENCILCGPGQPAIYLVCASNFRTTLFLSEMTLNHSWVYRLTLLLSDTTVSVTSEGQMREGLQDFCVSSQPERHRVQVLQEATLWGGIPADCFWAQEPVPVISSFMGPYPFLLLSLPCQQTLWSSRGKVQNESNSFYFLWCFQRCKKCHALQCAWIVGKMSVPDRRAGSPQLLWRWSSSRDPGKMLLSFGPSLTLLPVANDSDSFS